MAQKTETSEKPEKNVLYCSFCGKSQHEVRKLIAGPSVFICNECIELCMDICYDEGYISSELDRVGKLKPEDWQTEKRKKLTGQAALENDLQALEENLNNYKKAFKVEQKNHKVDYSKLSVLARKIDEQEGKIEQKKHQIENCPQEPAQVIKKPK